MYVVRITDADGRRTETEPMPRDVAERKARDVNAMAGWQATIHPHRPDQSRTTQLVVGIVAAITAAGIAALLIAGGTL
jgi:hypothetical protein